MGQGRMAEHPHSKTATLCLLFLHSKNSLLHYSFITVFRQRHASLTRPKTGGFQYLLRLLALRSSADGTSIAKDTVDHLRIAKLS